jgi:hypothetical protein
MTGRTEGSVLIEDAKLIFRNFTGKESEYNRAGSRNFGVILPEELAQQMLRDGWNVKRLRPREDDENPEGTPWISVQLGYNGRPPAVVVINSRGRENYGEAEVETLDWYDIKTADVKFRPYNWVVREGTPKEDRGVKAYLEKLFVTINEDALDLKYADIPKAHGEHPHTEAQEPPY